MREDRDGRGAAAARGGALARMRAALLHIGTARERMGPGGLRGLQILRSGVERVRGGFDSHAFPPSLRVGLAAGLVVTALAAAAASAVHAQDAPDPADAPEIAELLAARARGRAVERKKTFDAPGWVMARSLVVPGWGQAHNGAWLKAGLVAATEVYLGLRVIDEERKLNDLEAQVNALPAEDPMRNAMIDDYNERLDTQTGRQWFLAAVVTYALLDAYVDAHFRDFSIALDVDGHGSGGGRVALRRTF